MDLAAPIEEVKGIGPKTAEILHKAGIFTLRDLVYHLPRDYEDFQQAQDIASLKPGKVTVKAKVESITTRRMRRNLALTEATLRDKTGAIKVIWFNQPYRAKQFDQDKEYYFSGTMALSYGHYQISNPSATLASDYDKALEYFEKRFLDVSSYDTLAEEQVFRALGGNKIIIFHNVLHECLFTLVC